MGLKSNALLLFLLQHTNPQKKNCNNNPPGSSSWNKPDYVPADTEFVDMWQADYGAEDQIQYLKSRNAIVVAPSANYPIFTDEMAQMSSRVGGVVRTQSWKMVFAKNDAEYESLKADMIKKAESLGINGFVTWNTDAYAKALELASGYTK